MERASIIIASAALVAALASVWITWRMFRMARVEHRTFLDELRRSADFAITLTEHRRISAAGRRGIVVQIGIDNTRQ